LATTQDCKNIVAALEQAKIELNNTISNYSTTFNNKLLDLENSLNISLDEIIAKNVVQDRRLTAIEIKEQADYDDLLSRIVTVKSDLLTLDNTVK
jgi:hypothetical protein